MDVRGDFYTTQQAADALGVSARRVLQMTESGQLTRVARGLVDATSVDRYRSSGQGRRTRVWAEHTAWAAIALLSGSRVDWLGQTQLSRLRGALREITVPALVRRTRDRAVVHHYDAHPAAISRLAERLVVTDSMALGLVDGVGIGGVPLSGFSERDAAQRLTGYMPVRALEGAVRELGLQEAPTGNVTVRCTDFDLAIIRQLASTETPVLVALDAATALDPRERGSGVLTLDIALQGFRA